MFFIVASFVFSLLLIATVCDVRTREIPDWIAIAIAIVAMVSSLFGWLGIGLVWVLAGGGLGLSLGLALFHFAKLGGGDAKLIAALGLVVGPVGLILVLFGTAIAGGALSLVAYAQGKKDLAYVPAILAGFVGYCFVVSRIAAT